MEKPIKAKCESCGAAIVWGKTYMGGPLPLNATRVRTYKLGGNDEEMAMVDRDIVGNVELSYVSHFLTCPNASHHSKGGSSG